jgi:S1-C subfamily serine protease
MARVRAELFCFCALLWGALGCAPVKEVGAAEPFEAIRNATISLTGRCAGVVAEDGMYAVTAAHCIRPGEGDVAIQYSNGVGDTARIASLDRAQDIAILKLGHRAPVKGLAFADALPIPGTGVYFGGRLNGPRAAQFVQIMKLGRCPSLPDVPQALFTSLRGQKGDSGAPVVDTNMRVVGLVHGGAACSIAAPTQGVTRMLAAIQGAPAAFGVGGAGDAAH